MTRAHYGITHKTRNEPWVDRSLCVLHLYADDADVICKSFTLGKLPDVIQDPVEEFFRRKSRVTVYRRLELLLVEDCPEASSTSNSPSVKSMIKSPFAIRPCRGGVLRGRKNSHRRTTPPLTLQLVRG